MGKRRPRSKFSKEDCFSIVEEFSKRIVRMGTTTSAGIFRFQGSNGGPPMTDGHLNAQIMFRGEDGDNDDFFEAMWVLSGAVFPRKS